MSGSPKSIWLMVHESQSGDEYSADKTASVGLPRPTVVRYDLADPERDAREAEALDAVLDGPRRWLPADWPSEEQKRVREIIVALRDRLRGGGK